MLKELVQPQMYKITAYIMNDIDDVRTSSEESVIQDLISKAALKEHLKMSLDKLNKVVEPPSVEQKLFLVVSVALATLCFFTNVVQVGVFLRPSILKSPKSLLMLSQAVSGIFASFVVVFPIQVISGKGTPIGPTGYSACYLGHSGIILVALLASLSTATLIVVHHYFNANNPRKYITSSRSLFCWAGVILFVWIYSFTVAVLPWAGWNSWKAHDALCHLSTLWPLSFSAFLTFIVGVHMASTLLIWASTRAARLRASEARAAARANRLASGEEADPITHVVIKGKSEGSRVPVYGWIITVVSMAPLVGHVVVASSCAASSICMSSPHHYHEDESSLPWVTLLLTAAGVANPLLYVFSDEQVSLTTLQFMSSICCWWKRGKTQQPTVSAPQPTERGSDVYVTNDTDFLVGDNT